MLLHCLAGREIKKVKKLNGLLEVMTKSESRLGKDKYLELESFQFNKVKQFYSQAPFSGWQSAF